MELGEVSDVVRSYPWRCIECKICEICQEKGDDVRCLYIPCGLELTSPHRSVYYFVITVTEVNRFPYSFIAVLTYYAR